MKRNHSAVFWFRWKPLVAGGRFCYRRIHLPLHYHPTWLVFYYLFAFFQLAECFILKFSVQSSPSSDTKQTTAACLTFIQAVLDLNIDCCQMQNICMMTSFDFSNTTALMTFSDWNLTCLSFLPVFLDTRVVHASADFLLSISSRCNLLSDFSSGVPPRKAEAAAWECYPALRIAMSS